MSLTSLLKMMHIIPQDRIDKPLDEIQMEAAKDRLTQRGKQIEEEVDELSKMIRRLKRKDDNR